MPSYDDELSTLESLLSLSKTPAGRSNPTLAGTLTTLLPSSPPPLLLPRLRLLRNLCAGDPPNQAAFLASAGPDHVFTAVLSPPLPPPPSLHVALQLLGNAALAGDQHRAAVWARFFPEGFQALAPVPDPAVCGALCMVLDTCCAGEGGRERLRELCSEDSGGLPVLLKIISVASAVGYQQEWLEWLFVKICIEENYFSLLFRRLSSSGDIGSNVGVESQSAIFNREQAFLMRVLSKTLTERPDEVTVPDDFAPGILDVLKKASGVVDFYSRGSSELPTGSPAVDVLGYSLTILRDVCARDPLTEEDQVNSLLSAGLLQFILTFLRELEPPSVVRKSIGRARDPAGPLSVGEPLKVCPYLGFRRDVVSVIAYCAYQRKQVQDEIRKQNGILVLLQQCVVDEDNPFLREWGLLAVRNLLEGNSENQRDVADLQLREPVNTPEIAELGLRVEMDEGKRRAKLVNNS